MDQTDFVSAVSVIVEEWGRLMRSGSLRRKYEAEFSFAERHAIADGIEGMRAWAFRTGVPSMDELPAERVDLIHRVAGFLVAN